MNRVKTGPVVEIPSSTQPVHSGPPIPLVPSSIPSVTIENISHTISNKDLEGSDEIIAQINTLIDKISQMNDTVQTSTCCNKAVDFLNHLIIVLSSSSLIIVSGLGLILGTSQNMQQISGYVTAGVSTLILVLKNIVQYINPQQQIATNTNQQLTLEKHLKTLKGFELALDDPLIRNKLMEVDSKLNQINIQKLKKKCC